MSWIDPVGGSFHDGSKWSIGTPPGAGDGAAFSLHATYLVSLAQPVQNASLNIVAGVVTFDLGGFAYTSAVTPLTVAPAPGPSSQLTLLNGTLNSPGLEIASTAGSSGRVVISGSDAALTTTWGTMNVVGRQGRGRLLLENGGAFAAGLHTHIALMPGSEGEVHVQGPESTWTCGGDAFCGYFGRGTALITGGGSASNLNIIIGGAGGGEGIFRVSGPGSSSSTTFKIAVGSAGGSEGILLVDDGGYVYSGIASIGEHAPADGVALILGKGSHWEVLNALFVGLGGSGRAIVAEGGLISSKFGRVGHYAGSHGEVEITGPSSRWEAAEYIDIGVPVGTSGFVTLEEGGGLAAPLVDIGAGGAMRGEGVITGSVSNAGSVEPGAAGLAISGAFTQAHTGTLVIDLSAPGPNGHGRVIAGGPVTLGGTLELRFADGYQPSPGDEFCIIETGNVTGAFYTIVTPKSPKMPGGAFVIEAYCDSPGCVLLRYEDAAAAALPTPGDVTFDCHVNMQDLALLLGAWGLCPDPQDGPCHEDLDDSGAVDVQDLLILLQNWG